MIAICYWGLTRSTKMVYQSHSFHLKEYDIFLHTWKTDEHYIRTEPCTVPIDYEEYKLLSPNYYQIDNQSEFLNSLHFSDYFDEELYLKGKEWNPLLIRNHLCALESQKRVTDMVLNSGKKYDYVIYVRPDVMIYSTFKLEFLPKEKTISIPNEDHYQGYNDRFAIVRYEDCSYYGKRIDEILEFRKKHGIVSEKYVKYIIEKYFEHVQFIEYHFELCRP